MLTLGKEEVRYKLQYIREILKWITYTFLIPKNMFGSEIAPPPSPPCIGDSPKTPPIWQALGKTWPKTADFPVTQIQVQSIRGSGFEKAARNISLFEITKLTANTWKRQFEGCKGQAPLTCLGFFGLCASRVWGGA